MSLPYRWQWRIERWRNALRRFFGGEPQAARPRLCPACNTLVGTTASRCHECGTRLNFSLAAASKSLSGFWGGEMPVTSMVFVVNILLFGVSLLLTARFNQNLDLFGGISEAVLDRMGASRPLFFLGNEWWRLVTAVFLHGGLLHIGMNMWVLMDVGPQVEQLYGSARYFFLYIVTGIAGFLVSSFWGNFAIGASGAIMGLIGLMIAVTTRRSGAHMRMLRGRLLVWVASIFVIGFLVRGVDNAGHLGGLASGYVLGRIFADREPMNSTERNRAYLLGWIAGLAVIASFALMLRQYVQLSSLQF